MYLLNDYLWASATSTDPACRPWGWATRGRPDELQMVRPGVGHLYLLHPTRALGLQIAQSRSYLYTLGLKVGIVYVLGAPGQQETMMDTSISSSRCPTWNCSCGLVAEAMAASFSTSKLSFNWAVQIPYYME